MIEVLGFCIDRTEVTVGQYAAFLEAMSNLPDRGLSGQPSECAGNEAFQPPYWWPANDIEVDAGKSKSEVDSMPVGIVDWCDARAFCAWAGKRLCGRMGGGRLTRKEGAGTTSEWYVACSHNGLNKFPYGNAFTDGACNGVDGRTREPVGSNPGCTGGYEGLVDMSGNVSEWIDACDVDADGGLSCLTSGGTYNFPAQSLGCNGAQSKSTSDLFPQGGFRCCATPGASP